MLDSVLRTQLERHWEYAGKDEDIAHEIYADDAVLEFPQGGERYEGVENFREWRRIYPAEIAFKIRRLDRWGDLVVAELLISYDGGPPMYTVNLIELNADDKIVHERIYIMEGWEAPEWRAPWRSETPADSVTWEQTPTISGKGRHSAHNDACLFVKGCFGAVQRPRLCRVVA